MDKHKSFVIIDVRDVGYRVFAPENLLFEMAIGQGVELHIHQHIREDAHSLFGFKSYEQLELFELLLTISGIGPKSALAVLSAAGVGEIKDSIARGDSSLLLNVSGIGKKTAERVVLDLRDKIRQTVQGADDAFGASASAGGDELEALMSLGYSLFEARDALRMIDQSIKDSGERIRAALRLIKG